MHRRSCEWTVPCGGQEVVPVHGCLDRAGRVNPLVLVLPKVPPKVDDDRQKDPVGSGEVYAAEKQRRQLKRYTYLITAAQT